MASWSCFQADHLVRRTRRAGSSVSEVDGRTQGQSTINSPPHHSLLSYFQFGDIMKVCGACERELPDGSYSEEQRRLRQSSRQCEECVAKGNELLLMKKGRTRSEGDDCPICSLPLPLDWEQSMFQPCCTKKLCNGCILAALKRNMRDCPFCRTPRPKKSQSLAGPNTSEQGRSSGNLASWD